MLLIEADRDRYAADGKPPVEWERYLEVAPGLLPLEPEARAEALAARELDVEAWTRAESYWVLTFALDLQHGRTDRVEAFGRACAGARDAHRGQSPEPPARGPVADGPSGVSAPEPQSAAAALAIRREDNPPSAEPSAAAVDLPTFLWAADAPATPRPVAVALAAPRPPTVAVRPPELTCDAMPVQREGALPFGQRPSAEYAARLAHPVSARAPAPRVRPDATLVPASRAAEPTLPFAGGRAGPGRPPCRLPELTVEQFATLSAELSIGREPAQRAEVLARHGIESADALASLGADWQSRLNADAGLMERWRAAYARSRAELQPPRRR